MRLLDWLFPKRKKACDDGELPFTKSFYPPGHVWSLTEFSAVYGRMRLYIPSGQIEKVVFTNGSNSHTVVCVSNELKSYSADAISRYKDHIIIRVMDSCLLCMYKEWETVNL